MRCVSCGDLIGIAVVDSTGQPVGACGWEGLLVRAGQLVSKVSYWSGDKLHDMASGDVKLVYTAAANLRPLEKILALRAVK